MTQKITVEKKDWEKKGHSAEYCKELERGNILFFPELPFPFPQDEIDFLLAQKQGRSSGRKNIAYKPQIDRITNHNAKDRNASAQLKKILKNYSERVTLFLSGILAPYAETGWRHDYASFRPFQEKGRKLRLRARNDLLHFDAFPTRPLNGARIFRFFTNINPKEDRHWITSSGFESLVKEFSDSLSIPDSLRYNWISRFQRKLKQFARAAGFKTTLRSPYDEFMLNFHNFLKEHETFQESCPKDHWKFPPASCWAVFTDQVSHAALAGQYALEQTFIIPQKALLFPEWSPLAVLERISGKNLTE